MGRPKGAKNKRSRGIPPELAEQLGHRDPAEVLAEVYSMPLDQLKRQVRSKGGAIAMSMRIQAAVAAMPYVHSKMPVKVELPNEKLPFLVIATSTHQIEQFQRLKLIEHQPVAASPVAGQPQPVENKDKSDG